MERTAEFETTAAALDRGQPACSIADPLAVIEEEYALQLELCDVLEALADRLPDRADRELAGVAVSILNNGLAKQDCCETAMLFPLMRRHATANAMIEPMIRQLEIENAFDQGRAHEIADALMELATEGTMTNAEATGYMLRCFFEARRRRISWERALLLPMARALLSTSDLRTLQRWLLQNGRPACVKRSLTALRSAKSIQEICQSCAKDYNFH